MNKAVTSAKAPEKAGTKPGAVPGDTPDIQPNTKTRLVAAAIELLRSGGLAAAGLNEVAARAQAPKGSLYHYFPGGKAELVQAALAAYAQAVAQRLAATMSAPTPLAERVALVFGQTAEVMASQRYSQSCAVGAVSLDLGLDDEAATVSPNAGLARSGMADGATKALRQACADALALWAHTAAKAMPELKPSARPAAGRSLISLLEGSQLLARAQRSRQPFDDARDTFVAYLQAQPLQRPIS